MSRLSVLIVTLKPAWYSSPKECSETLEYAPHCTLEVGQISRAILLSKTYFAASLLNVIAPFSKDISFII